MSKNHFKNVLKPQKIPKILPKKSLSKYNNVYETHYNLICIKTPALYLL